MEYPYGYCGMPCALCTRYRTNGKSKCEGCSLDGYYSDVCKVHHCCREKKLSGCGLCELFPCARLGRMSDFRDLNTCGAKLTNCRDVSQYGFDAWYENYKKLAQLLDSALVNYNDGRMKRYICELFMRTKLDSLQELIKNAEAIKGDPKERGIAFRQLAESMSISVHRGQYELV